ncbi:MAG: endolytic transglycosylase MltG [Pseudolabrys sp.]|nr:endolytic transglycosylase MltG [Pseudolabrys sp.]
MFAGSVRLNSDPPPSGNGSGPLARGPIPQPLPSNNKPPRSPRHAIEPERVPLPKRRSRRVRHPLVIVGNAIFTLLVVISVAVGGALFVGRQRFEAPGPLAQDKVVNIPRGAGIREIADILRREGVIDQVWVFMGGVIALKAGSELKYGEYQFIKHASIADVVDTIIENKVVQHAVTIPEGLTSEQIVARLLENAALAGQIKEIPREGTLLPETYKFTRGMARDQIVQRMQQAHKRVLTEVWEHRVQDIPIRTPEQLVIMASIVEKETGRPDERTRVAAVFMNRLKTKMRLQSDPTIIYGLTGGKGALGRPIMKSEIEQHTAYNTYVIDGLPPGPIANPGRASLEAAANPARTKELYFVADGTGGHVFSENYDAHQKNVARLRTIEHGNAPPLAAKR